VQIPRPRLDRGQARRFRGPAPTIRLRLTVLYGLVFLITGAVLLTIGYALVRHDIGGGPFRIRVRGINLPPTLLPQFGSTPRDFALAQGVHDQIVNDALHRLLAEYLFALGAMTMLSVGAGWLLAGRALRPLRDITATARRVSGENLGERISLSGPADELKELADTFDGMLGRLDAAFASQRHFVANASHELRTPLAIMRTEVDVSLADSEASAEELRRMGEAVRETVDRCERLIESLLMLARSEAATGREEPVDLAALAGDCITDLMARSQDAAVRVQDDLEPAWVRGEPGLLERMIANLLDNGIQHNERGGFLNVSTRNRTRGVELIVRNGGPRIDPQDALTLTEPFRRLDRAYGGFGLGLSIVRSVAEVHGGTTEIFAPATGGLEVRIHLPALPTTATAAPASSASVLAQS
jgi:signal transduction histidine kinase